MNAGLKENIYATDKDAQYDACAKKLLGQKIILAYILVRTVEEFHGMNPKDVVAYIEGNPYIGEIPLDPGITNTQIIPEMSEKMKEENGTGIRIPDKQKNPGTQLIGWNTENTELFEGTIFFDIIFSVLTRSGKSKIIINLEAQKDEPTKYKILNRGIFYGCRMISSQKEREFVKSNYNDIKQVYSIWICMGMKENVLNHIHLEDEKILGDYKWKGNMGLLNIVMIGLSETLPVHDNKYELHRLLGALLSDELPNEEKVKIIETEYDIQMDREWKKETEIMCNLSQGIKEKGREQGETKMGTLIKKLIELDRQSDIERIAEDKTFRQKLYKELDIM